MVHELSPEFEKLVEILCVKETPACSRLIPRKASATLAQIIFRTHDLQCRFGDPPASGING